MTLFHNLGYVVGRLCYLFFVCLFFFFFFRYLLLYLHYCLYRATFLFLLWHVHPWARLAGRVWDAPLLCYVLLTFTAPFRVGRRGGLIGGSRPASAKRLLHDIFPWRYRVTTSQSDSNESSPGSSSNLALL